MARKENQYKNNFMLVANTVAKDSGLSLQAKGLFFYLWSLPKDWDFHFEEIIKHATNGRDATRRALKELEAKDYVVRTKSQNKVTGQFDGWYWVLNDEESIQENTDLLKNLPSDNRLTEKPTVGKSSTTNNKYTNNKLTNNKKRNIKENGQNGDFDPHIYQQVIDYLNQKAGTKYRASSKSTQRLIKARINDGFKLEDFKKVIDNKANDWLKDKVMGKYLRPETLFSNKFEGYLNQNSGSNHSASYEQFNMQSLQAPPIEDMDDDDLPF